MKARELSFFSLAFFLLAAAFGTVTSLFRGAPLAGDFFFFTQPLQHYVSELLERGQMPLWNPYLSCGCPLLANLREGIFYPLSAVYRIFNIVLANQCFLFMHYYLAGLFAWLFARSRG